MNPTIFPSDLIISSPEWDDGFLEIKVYWKNTNHKVAYVRCRHYPDGVMELEDIVVKSDYVLPRSRLFRWIRRPDHRLNFRGIGIGSNLLDMVLCEARRANVATIWGSVVETDPVLLNRLLRWYQTFGFRVEEPDDRCLPNADRMVVWESSTHRS